MEIREGKVSVVKTYIESRLKSKNSLEVLQGKKKVDSGVINEK